MPACTRELHESWKHDEVLWQEKTSFPQGLLERPVTAVGDHFVQWADCLNCRSTLARRIEITLRVQQ